MANAERNDGSKVDKNVGMVVVEMAAAGKVYGSNADEKTMKLMKTSTAAQVVLVKTAVEEYEDNASNADESNGPVVEIGNDINTDGTNSMVGASSAEVMWVRSLTS